MTFGVASDESITGWYLDKDLTTKVESVTIANANVTLYPKVEKGYWITFESNGGTYVAPEFFANGYCRESARCAHAPRLSYFPLRSLLYFFPIGLLNRTNIANQSGQLPRLCEDQQS